jgi:hypothetical protein
MVTDCVKDKLKRIFRFLFFVLFCFFNFYFCLFCFSVFVLFVVFWKGEAEAKERGPKDKPMGECAEHFVLLEHTVE